MARVRVIRDRVIKLDLDRKPVSWRRLARRLKLAEHLFGLKIEKIVIHETNHGYHVRILTRKKLEPVVIVALQACLGSDYKRELLNLRRIVIFGVYANVLHNSTEKRLVFVGPFENFLKWSGYDRHL